MKIKPKTKKLMPRSKPVAAKPVKRAAVTHTKHAPAKPVKRAAVAPAASTKRLPVAADVPAVRRSKNVVAEAVAPAASTPRLPVAADAPRIECRLRVGELYLPVDASSLERTLGAGQWGNGRGLMDAWPDTAWAGLLAHLKLPAEPLDRAVADQPVKRLVQRLWYEAVKGGVPEERKAVFEARDAERVEEYKQKFDGAGGVKDKVVAKKERAKTSFGRSGETHYTPTDALKSKKLVLNGQAGILVKAFRDADFKPMTTQEATDAMVKAGLVTGTDPRRIAAFYLSQFATKKNLLTRN